jgi:hypothetical protein
MCGSTHSAPSIHAKIEAADILQVSPINPMLLNELTPIFKELTQEPAAFCSGFLSGVLRLNLTDDPVKTWLEKQAGFTPTGSQTESGSQQGPQSIDID